MYSGKINRTLVGGLLAPLVIFCGSHASYCGPFQSECVMTTSSDTCAHMILPPASAHKTNNCSHTLHHYGSVFSRVSNSSEKTLEQNKNLPFYCAGIAASCWTCSIQHRNFRRRLWGIVRQLVCMIYDRGNNTCLWLQQNWFQSALFFFNVCFVSLSFLADNYGGYENQLFKGNDQGFLLCCAQKHKCHQVQYTVCDHQPTEVSWVQLNFGNDAWWE